MSSQADALRHELDRQRMQGRDDRVADIQKELAGLEPETTEAAAPSETAAAKRPTRKR